MENSNYTEAAKRVKKLKNFYNSIPVYIVVCLAYFAFCTGLFDDGAISTYIPWWSPVIMASCWGMGLLIYYFYITRGSKIEHKYKKWEQRNCFYIHDICSFFIKVKKELIFGNCNSWLFCGSTIFYSNLCQHTVYRFENPADFRLKK